MDKFLVIRRDIYGNQELVTLASTLLFNTEYNAQHEAELQANTYANPYTQFEVRRLGEVVATVTAQPTEAADK